MRYLTIVLKVPNDYTPAEIHHPYFSAASWSHALDDRDRHKRELDDLKATLPQGDIDET
ncbi:hypothetical protein [Acinetobacter sp.]|uniref:hypothetical protein n=1 Tax=Acinetobacter sp. TaxID=472 RepID=UPI00388DA3CF